LLGVAAVRRGQPARGARLMAAARARAEEPGPPAVLREWLEGLGGGKPQGPRPGSWAESGAARISTDQAEARAAMASDAFAAACAEGEAMSLDEASTYALGEERTDARRPIC